MGVRQVLIAGMHYVNLDTLSEDSQLFGKGFYFVDKECFLSFMSY